MKLEYRERPTVILEEEDRKEILLKAQERHEIGAAYRKQFHPYLDGEAEDLNRPGNHISGELTERAVSLWLHDQGIEHSRPPSLKEELEDKLPDIATEVDGVALDVKSKIEWPDHCLIRCDQVKKNAPKLGVIWCKPRRPMEEYDNYDSYVPLEAEMWGWVTMAEAESADNDGEHHHVPRTALRSLDRLLEWIATGALPPHP